MKSIQSRFLALSLVILPNLISHVGATEWIKLFDGKSFDGWFQTGGKHTYEIIDQSIVGISVPKEGNGFMTTEEKYRNFELKFEVKLDLGLNSDAKFDLCHYVKVPPDWAAGGNRRGRSGFVYGEAMKKKMAQGKAGLAPIWSRKKRNQSKVPSRKANGILFLFGAMIDIKPL